MRPLRLPEVIASSLRAQILSGELQDGDRLPSVDRLMEHFQVSGPSIREALRVLETEGLVTMRLGKVGGASVHSPRPERAAYMLALVLESQRVRANDVSDAIRDLSMVCVRRCALRPDRSTTVVPALRAALERASEGDDLQGYLGGLAQFHHSLVVHCGNESFTLVAIAFDALWDSQGLPWPHDATGGLGESRTLVLDAHAAVINAVERGDAVAAAAALGSVMGSAEGIEPPCPNPVVRAEKLPTRMQKPPYGDPVEVARLRVSPKDI